MSSRKKLCLRFCYNAHSPLLPSLCSRERWVLGYKDGQSWLSTEPSERRNVGYHLMGVEQRKRKEKRLNLTKYLDKGSWKSYSGKILLPSLFCYRKGRFCVALSRLGWQEGRWYHMKDRGSHILFIPTSCFSHQQSHSLNLLYLLCLLR